MLTFSVLMFIVVIALSVYRYIRMRETTSDQFDNIAERFGIKKSNVSLAHDTFQCRIGGPDGKPFLCLMTETHFVFMKPGGKPDDWTEIGYDEIDSLRLELPHTPLIMSTTIPAMLANNLTQWQSGMNIVIGYSYGRFQKSLTIGGLSHQSAKKIIEKIESF